MRAEYSEPIHRSEAECYLCTQTFHDYDCCECLSPRPVVVEVRDLCIGVNGDRANIVFNNGQMKNVSVDTLRLLMEEETT